ncbi:MAG: hypothetical protein WBE09_16425, partial [Candidatus Acidiferrales bacterium]
MNSAIRNRITRALIGILAFAALLIVAGSAFAQENSWNLPPSPASAVRTPADDAITVTSDKFITERPTLISAGFEWMIHGDSNRNAKVEVTFRKKGESTWHPAMPLMRLQFESIQEVPKATRQTTLHPPILNYVAPNAFSGSVFNLDPGTEYEFRFVLSDPDGVKGDHEKVVSLKTRAEPMPAKGGNVYHVYPEDWTGPKQEPAFTGLLAAYYVGAFDADYWDGYPPRVRPGDTILVHAGVYKDTGFRYYYGHTNPIKVDGKVTDQLMTTYGLFFDGTYYLHANGTPDKPIVIKAAGDGEAIFDGNGVAVLFDLTKSNYNYFEGLTIRNADIAFLTGRKAYWGGDGFTLKHCKIEDVGRGVHGDWGLAKDYYIADNTFIGRIPLDRIIGYGSAALYGKDPAWPVPLNCPKTVLPAECDNHEPGGSEYAVKVYGQGHVVAYNHVEGWHDGIDNQTYGNPDADCELCYGAAAPDQKHTTEEDLDGSIDFYGNDLSNLNDNCFEMDGASRNVRIFKNRCFNDANSGLSIDPGFGGPFYFFQNIYYDNVGGVGGCGYSCAGMLFYQNTIIDEVGGGGRNVHFLNNLIVAAGASTGNGHSYNPKTGRPVTATELDQMYGVGNWGLGKGMGPYRPVFSMNTMTNYSSSDYNGFGPDPREEIQFRWDSPPSNVVADYDYTHPLVKQNFKTLAEYAAGTGQEKHSILIGLDDFMKVTLPSRDNVQKLYNPADFDFRLRPGSKAIDAGVLLPTINDGFTGKAPDLGALESGTEPPHYG